MKNILRPVSVILCIGLIFISGCGENAQTSNSPPESKEESVVKADINPSELSNEEKAQLYRYIVDGETEWLASIQLENGAMPMTYNENGKVTVNPYFSDFAALALLEGDTRYYDSVKRYIDWHFSHLNTKETDYNGVDGTIYDYTAVLSGGKLTEEEIVMNSNGKPSYDSVDSYAATFLCVLQKYYEKTNDAEYLKQHSAEIERAYNPIKQVMDNGLTWTKPDYLIKYLMDNCEVYEGLAAAEKLFDKALNNQALTDEVSDYKKQVADAIENQMWRDEGYYEAALGENGASAYGFSWTDFYPCATAQLMMISSGLLKPSDSRAVNIYNTFNQHYSTGESKHTWESLSMPDSFFWGSVVYTAALMNDEGRVEKYMTQYKKAMKTHTYPLYNADSARVCLAASLMIKNIEE